MNDFYNKENIVEAITHDSFEVACVWWLSPPSLHQHIAFALTSLIDTMFHWFMSVIVSVFVGCVRNNKLQKESHFILVAV